MSDPVYLWQATGPAIDASGMSGDRAQAQEDAAQYLLDGRASTALVEEAEADVGGMRGGARQSYYLRTGEAWHAEGCGPDGVTWVAVKAETAAA